MIDPVTSRRIAYWGLFLMIWTIVLFVRILPLDITAGRWPGPNWTILFAFAWVLRRPNFVPVLLVAIVLLLDDMIYLRAPGLLAGLSLIALEFLRGRAQFSRELPFLFEWAMVASVIFGVMLANRLILGIFVITQPIFILDSFYYVITIMTYPLVVVFSSKVLGVRQAAPGEVDRLGHPI
ncbi:MAG: rod shape-determining protein MreD [Paracoccaceae bacterium]